MESTEQRAIFDLKQERKFQKGPREENRNSANMVWPLRSGLYFQQDWFVQIFMKLIMKRRLCWPEHQWRRAWAMGIDAQRLSFPLLWSTWTSPEEKLWPPLKVPVSAQWYTIWDTLCSYAWDTIGHGALWSPWLPSLFLQAHKQVSRAKVVTLYWMKPESIKSQGYFGPNKLLMKLVSMKTGRWISADTQGKWRKRAGLQR